MPEASRHSPRPRLRVPLHVVAAISSTVLISCVVALLSFTAYRGAERALTSATDDAIAQAASLLDERIARIFEPADNQLRLLAHSELSSADTLEARLALVPLARAVFAGNNMVQAMYAGYPSGEFVMFRALPDQTLTQAFDAPAGADLLVQTISDGPDGMQGAYHFFGADDRALATRNLPEYVFDPRPRPWFERARARPGETVLTDPYIFFTTRAPGVTLARTSFDNQAVIGLDAEIATLTAHIEELHMTRSSELAILDAGGYVVAYHDAVRMLVPDGEERFRLAHVDELGVLPLQRASELQQERAVGARLDGRGGEEWLLVRLPLEPVGALELFAVLGIPEDEMFAAARDIVRDQVRLALLILVVIVPLGWWLTHRTVASLRRLADETRAIESFDFSPRPHVASYIAEIEQLSSATERMRSTISNFLHTNVALGAESELDALLDTILGNVVEAARAEGGAIYRDDADLGGYARQRICVARAAAQGTLEAELPACVDAEDAVHIVAEAARSRYSRTTLTRGGGLRLATPLLTRSNELVGVIVVDLPQAREYPEPMRDPRVGFVEALSSSAAVAIETRELIEQQRRLLESFIQLIASAIDAKSPYTGGHCQRVPELAKLLAEAAHHSDAPGLRDFRMTDEDREALHIASWLHDCGKITTPEHIVDKATKLECIYNRIHEIRTRFEVLKRDARIGLLEARLDGMPVAEAEARLEEEWRQLDEDFAFVAECNLGSERMDEAAEVRLREIAARHWWRTLDDRLGISADEARLKGSDPALPLPVREALLQDAAWHRVPRPASEFFPVDNQWGFSMQPPELKQDLGELHNLSIRSGTLTPEDRYIINHHIIQTIVMLSRLPFPRHLAQVPEIAGGHHERVDGRGYPCGLKRDEMSLLARIMAVADVFEALTARDRPYKSARNLSDAIALMLRMVRNGHLDPELFALFLESGVYRIYAERFLEPEQIDAVEVDAVLAELRTLAQTA